MILRRWEKYRSDFIAYSTKNIYGIEIFFIFHVYRLIVRHKRYTRPAAPVRSCYGNFTLPSCIAWYKFANNSNLRFVQDRKDIDVNGLYRSFRVGKKWKQDFFAFSRCDGSIVSYRALYGKTDRPTQWLVACLFINIRAETAIAVDIVTYGHAEKHPGTTFYT